MDDSKNLLDDEGDGWRVYFIFADFFITLSYGSCSLWILEQVISDLPSFNGTKEAKIYKVMVNILKPRAI